MEVSVWEEFFPLTTKEYFQFLLLSHACKASSLIGIFLGLDCRSENWNKMPKTVHIRFLSTFPLQNWFIFRVHPCNIINEHPSRLLLEVSPGGYLQPNYV